MIISCNIDLMSRPREEGNKTFLIAVVYALALRSFCSQVLLPATISFLVYIPPCVISNSRYIFVFPVLFFFLSCLFVLNSNVVITRYTYIAFGLDGRIQVVTRT